MAKTNIRIPELGQLHHTVATKTQLHIIKDTHLLYK